MAETPDERLLVVAERVREVVLRRAAERVPAALLPTVVKSELPLAPARQGALTPEERLLGMAERVREVVLRRAAERVPGALLRRAAERVPEVLPRPAVAQPDERQREAAARRAASGQPEVSPVASEEPRLASQARRPALVRRAMT